MKRTWRGLVLAAALAAVLAGCVQQNAVKDFGEATATVGGSYGDLFIGSEDICRLHLEAQWVLGVSETVLLNIKDEKLRKTLEVMRTSPTTAIDEYCGRHREPAKVYRKLANALAGYGAMLKTLADKSSVDYSDKVEAVSTQGASLLKDKYSINQDSIDKHNKFVSVLLAFLAEKYVSKKIADIVEENNAYVLNTLDMLQTVNKIYQRQMGLLHDTAIALLEDEDNSQRNTPQYVTLVRFYLEVYNKRKAQSDSFAASIAAVRRAQLNLMNQVEAKLDLKDKQFVADMKKCLKEVKELYDAANALR